MSDPIESFANPQKLRTGFNRVMHATGYSLNGLRRGWREPAFRLEAILAIVLVPASLWIGRSWVESAVLAATVVLVLIVELLNTAIEVTVDRIGPEWHELSGRAKDLGSAAVFLSLVLAGCVWSAAIVVRFGLV
ncbi:diacylglycerol kinase [Caenimonas sp. SL110]|uniref:diacylglycerol kinase n=1 Tax=Caenimonas sp. SL110 TaxID=1450524 RepID=UPI000653B149|nr:diacylglycerol kinase [Caenimonas sp. SL110]